MTRASAVRDALINGGASPEQIRISAHGEDLTTARQGRFGGVCVGTGEHFDPPDLACGSRAIALIAGGRSGLLRAGQPGPRKARRPFNTRMRACHVSCEHRHDRNHQECGFRRCRRNERLQAARRSAARGNPEHIARNYFSDSGGRFFAGIWESTPGRWRVRYTRTSSAISRAAASASQIRPASSGASKPATPSSFLPASLARGKCWSRPQSST